MGRALAHDSDPHEPTTRNPGGSGSTVASRSTEDEARDLLALRRAKEGDDAAFAGLLRTNHSHVRALVIALAGPASADDLTLDAYVKAYRGLPLAEDQPARTWLLRAAIARCDDEQRRQSRHRMRARAAQPGEAGPPEPPIIPTELTRDERTVLALVDVVGLTPREAARVLDRDPADTVTLLAEARSAYRGADPEPSPLPAEGLAEGRPPLAPEQTPAGPEFWERLGAALLQARATPATPLHAGRTNGATPVTGSPTRERHLPPQDPGGASRTAPSRRGDALRAAQRSMSAPPRPWWKALALPVALAATAAVVIGLGAWLVGAATSRDANLGTTASKVLAKVDHSLAVDDTITADITIRRAGQQSSLHLVRTSGGSYRITRTAPAADEAWDSTGLHFTRVADGFDGQPPVLVDISGVAPGGPDMPAAVSAGLGDPLLGAVRLMNRSDATSVNSETVDGRAVWVVEGRLRGRDDSSVADALAGVGGTGQGEAGDRLRMVIDQSQLLPVSFRITRGASTQLEVEFSNYTVGNPLPPDAFAVPLPDLPGSTTAVTRAGLGFASTGLEQARSKLASLTFTPGFTPDGYALSLVATAPAGEAPPPGASNVPQHSGPVVVLVYRRGSQQFAVTLREAHDETALTEGWDGNGWSTSTISSGLFTGTKAHVSEAEHPLVWATGKGVTVTVSGDLSRNDALDVVRSLR